MLHESGRRALKLEGDSQIVNCVAAHPNQPVLAVSGIDSDIKIFSPGEPSEDESVRRACMDGSLAALDLAQCLADACTLRQEATALLTHISDRRHAEGNLAFKLGGLEDACASYERALDLLDFHLSPGDLQEEVISEQRKCYLNLAAVVARPRAQSHLRLGRCHAAATCCDRVLDNDPTNVKALYRRAQVAWWCDVQSSAIPHPSARLDLEQLRGCAADLQTALELEPTNRALLQLGVQLHTTRKRVITLLYSRLPMRGSPLAEESSADEESQEEDSTDSESENDEQHEEQEMS
ncbi:MAG: hypothetical protein SGPRY_004862 [Prymnesium sp.]